MSYLETRRAAKCGIPAVNIPAPVEPKKPVKKAGKPKPRQSKPPKKVSKKQAKELRNYTKVRKGFLVSRPRCEFEGCNQVSTEVHHKAGRTGANLYNIGNFLAVCRTHHQWIELNPEEAKAKGYSLSRLSKNI